MTAVASSLARMSDLPELRAAYDLISTTYAELLPDTSFEAPLDLGMIAEFAERLGTDPRVLDAGCGTGRTIPYLASLGVVDVVGTDLSPAMVERARAAHPELAFHAAPLAAQPFDDGTFDGVLAWYSIIHTQPGDLVAVAREFRRVLRPGGVALLGFQVGSGDRTISQAYGHDLEFSARLHEPAEVAAAFEAEGFAVDTVLRRGPRRTLAFEKHPQGFVLVRRA